MKACGKCAGMYVLLALFIGCASAIKVPTIEGELVPLFDKYSQLLSLFPEENQGLGLDPYAPGNTEQAMTYGLVLSAESKILHLTKSAERLKRTAQAVSWVLRNNMSSNPAPGWGIAAEWDAFNDGSVNVADQPYTITTAIVIEGLLDALESGVARDKQEKDDIISCIVEIFDYYLKKAWSFSSEDSGYFWYSTSDRDAYYTPNVSSAFLGVLSRFYSQYKEYIPDKTFYYSRLTMAINKLVGDAIIVDEAPYWYYYYIEGVPVRHINDLVHHCYIIWGVENYRSYVGNVSIPWGRDKSINSINAYLVDNHTAFWPYRAMELDFVESSQASRPATLWGSGMMLFLFSEYGEFEKAREVLAIIEHDYGPWPYLSITPPSFKEDHTFYSRFGAHVLFGLSNYLQKKHEYNIRQ